MFLLMKPSVLLVFAVMLFTWVFQFIQVLGNGYTEIFGITYCFKNLTMKGVLRLKWFP